MKIHNFSAGPACLPDIVLEAVQKSLLDYKQLGISVMEMSHRSNQIVGLFDEATSRVRSLLDIPKNYHILWLQGGASLQFSMIPLNLLPDNTGADYLDTGAWSHKAIIECNRVGFANVVGSSRESKYTFIPKKYVNDSRSYYFHITSNNTIYGTQFNALYNISRDNVTLVADMSSDILSRPIDISDFGIIYAGAQKNMGPAGATLVIIRDDLIGRNYRNLPAMLNYETHVEKDSMFNTPPVFSVFVINETLKWIEGIGGLIEMEKINKRKAEKLYHEIERNHLFKSNVNIEDRSMMNIPFVFVDNLMEDKDFLIFCEQRGLITLKGHRSIGGFRASIYNSMSESGVDALISAMQEYEKLIL
ncbi:MAG: 3-phosphoserine/phosphohydroxythreonine transaminase [Candidatus Neomarinimicrobiota bacterium]